MAAKKQVKNIKDMKWEILTAKRILKDPNLTKFASRKFSNTVEKRNELKFLKEGAVINELLEE